MRMIFCGCSVTAASRKFWPRQCHYAIMQLHTNPWSWSKWLNNCYIRRTRSLIQIFAVCCKPGCWPFTSFPPSLLLCMSFIPRLSGLSECPVLSVLPLSHLPVLFASAIQSFLPCLLIAWLPVFSDSTYIFLSSWTDKLPTYTLK
jgi:hypothetical protein